MEVKLLHATPLFIASTAIRKCWASEGKSDTNYESQEEIYTKVCNLSKEATSVMDYELGDKDKALIERVGNKFKHASTLEHTNYSFDIDGISRACLQELARHRHQSLSVKSSRYTLGELRERFKGKAFDDGGEVMDYLFYSVEDFCVIPKDMDFEDNIETKLAICNSLGMIAESKLSNDKAKYMLPEAYKTSLVSTMNMRALQNFLSLRTDKSALWEIQELAHKMFDVLPEEHKFMLVDFVKEMKNV